MNITSELNSLADKKRAEGEKNYLKSPMKHYGVRVPELRKIAKRWVKENEDLEFAKVLDFADKLWEGEYHEERMIAIYLLALKRNNLDLTHLKVLENWVRTSTGWAQLDCIAGWLLSNIYSKSPNQMVVVLRRWAKDDNLWVRRASLLTLMGSLRKEELTFKIFEELAIPMLSEKEFFIRKAIGWVLRDASKFNPAKVKSFVIKYKDQMSGLTLREATKYLAV